MTRRDRNHHRLRILLAQECARLMTEEGVKDFGAAKRKAALRLAVSDRAVLPDNIEIEQAVIEHQRLFHSQQQPAHLRKLRQGALEAMRFLARFRPKLVGAVLNGTAGLHDDIHLHLFSDTPNEVLLFLMEHNVPLEAAERRVTLNSGDQISVPAFRFKAGDAPFDLTVFTPSSEREPPRSPVDGKPLRRAGPSEVEALLATD